MNSLRIAIDGGAATGKSTVSKLVAKQLGIRYINTGQMYRLYALISIKENLFPSEEDIYNRIKDIDLTYDKDGFISTPEFDFEPDDLETKEVSSKASVVAAMPLVRKVASEKQIKIGKEPGVLLEGRDIGTVIMKDADFKIYIKVTPEVAAQRRVDQHAQHGEVVNYEDILKDILERNERDVTREVAPMMPTEKSIIIDSSDKTAQQIADIIVAEVTNG